MGYIDAHVHVRPDDTAHYPLAAGYKAADMRPRRFAPEELFKHCKPAGVDRVNRIQMSFCGIDIAEKLDGQKTKVTTVEVVLEPGQASLPHRHSGVRLRPEGRISVGH